MLTLNPAKPSLPSGEKNTTTNAWPSASPIKTVYLSERHAVPIGVTINHAPQ